MPQRFNAPSRFSRTPSRFQTPSRFANAPREVYPFAQFAMNAPAPTNATVMQDPGYSGNTTALPPNTTGNYAGLPGNPYVNKYYSKGATTSTPRYMGQQNSNVFNPNGTWNQQYAPPPSFGSPRDNGMSKMDAATRAYYESILRKMGIYSPR